MASKSMDTVNEGNRQEEDEVPTICETQQAGSSSTELTRSNQNDRQLATEHMSKDASQDPQFDLQKDQSDDYREEHRPATDYSPGSPKRKRRKEDQDEAPANEDENDNDTVHEIVKDANITNIAKLSERAAARANTQAVLTHLYIIGRYQKLSHWKQEVEKHQNVLKCMPKGKTLIMEVITNNYYCDEEMIRFLHKSGCPIGLVDEESGSTELILACVKGYPDEVLTYLVQNVNDPDYVHVVNKKGFTALLTALDTFRKHQYQTLANHRQGSAIEWFVIEAKKTNGCISRDCFDFKTDSCPSPLMYVMNEIVRFHLGSIELLHMLLDVVDKVNEQNAHGETALHIAVSRQHETAYSEQPKHTESKSSGVKRTDRTAILNIGVVEELLKAGADPNIQDQEGRTPLMLFCSIKNRHAKTFYDGSFNNTIHIYHLLKNAGSDLHKCDHYGKSPAFMSATSGDVEILNTMIEEGVVDKDSQNENGDTLLITAARYRHYNVLNYLLEKGCNVNKANKFGATAVMAVVEILQDDITLDYMENIIFREHDMPDKIVKCICALSEANADTNQQDKDGQTALHKIASTWSNEIISIIHQNMQNTGLAQDTGTILKIIQRLVKSMRNPDMTDSEGNTATHLAIQKHHFDMAGLIVRYNNDINITNKMGYSLVHELCASLRPRISYEGKDKVMNVISILLEMGASVNTKDITRSTPLFTVIKKAYNIDFADILVKHGANINVRNCLGQTVLHVLSAKMENVLKEEYYTIILWIISHKMDVNALDHFKHSPLHISCYYGNKNVTKLLIENGANVFAADRNGLKPFIFAAKHPSTLRTFIECAKAQGAQWLFEDFDDVVNIMRFAHFYNTRDEVEDILSTLLSNPSLKSVIDFSRLPSDAAQSSPECIEINTMIREHKKQHQNRTHFCLVQFSKYACMVVPDEVQKKTEAFIKDVFARVNKKHPFLPWRHQQSGSVGEGTKVISADEFDFLTDQDQNITKMFDIIGSEGSHHVKLVCARPIGSESIPEVECIACRGMMSMREGDVLSRDDFLSHYYGSIADTLDDPDLFEKHPSITRLEPNDITASNRNISCLLVAIHSELYPMLQTTIDIVPAFHFNSIPEWCKTPNFTQTKGCRVVGKWASDKPLDSNLFQLSFSDYDSEVYATMPLVLVHAYKLAKVTCHDAMWPEIKNTGLRASAFITSYMMKTATIMLHMASVDLECFEEDSGDEDEFFHYIHQVMHWARAIFRLLVVAFEEGFLGCTYIPGLNLFHGFDKYFEYKDTAVMHASALAEFLAFDECQIQQHRVEEALVVCVERIRMQAKSNSGDM